ncbi:MAG: hypothetical protein A2381_13515 [Bdellovibrionales bacterium RIFOXYB1_FULL_37_110]|nr:MAG: hypothetical protein A2417_08175 [Bdellovibrionales bacterium RIFOXYC1_FULL_37_79]OFZ59464.1 MAG: hypothetical protein A2381_13515 [Bdellovibrionales bacterium RIFOXYB1_FULL_37_110]OFZ64311.1 MAG: hypothetical protein A2577_02640 [Bdellovibrionales bacterium RIFOXYD1_FULL_36_51]
MSSIDFSRTNKLRSSSVKSLFNKQIVWLDTKEAAVHLRITANNLRVKVSRGEIQVDGKLGHSWRFRRDRLDELLESSINGGSYD